MELGTDGLREAEKRMGITERQENIYLRIDAAYLILCIIAYHLHFTSTFALLRKMNWFMRLCMQMFIKGKFIIRSCNSNLRYICRLGVNCQVKQLLKAGL